MQDIAHHVSPTAAGQQRLAQAIAAFQKAWELRSLAAPEDRHVFAKALYGWGYALEDRAQIERDAHGKPDPKLVQAAQDKYRAFLDTVARILRLL